MAQKVKYSKAKLKVDLLDEIIGTRVYASSEVELTREVVERMLGNILIATPVQALIRSIKRKEWKIKTEDKALQERMKNIENFDEMVESILEAMFFGYTVNEVCFNDDYSIRELREIPREMLRFDYVNRNLKLTLYEEYDLEEPKFVTTYHRRNFKYYLGRSILFPLLVPFLEYEDLDNNIRKIQEKYGTTIPVFGYEKSLGDTPEGIASIKKQAEALSGLSAGKVLAIPLIPGSTLKDGFQYINLSDLDIDIHLKLRDKLEGKVIRHLLGSTLTMEMISGGSFALGEIHAKEKEKAEMEMTEFVKDELNKLLRIDNKFFGSDPKAEFIYSEKLNEVEQFKLNATIADLRTKTISVITNLQTIGYSLSKEAICEILEIKEEDLIDFEIPKEGGDDGGENNI